MLRTAAAPVQQPEAVPVQLRPVPEPSAEVAAPAGPGAVRCLSHPHELCLRGIPVTCPSCRARRDWLLINQGRHVWVVCRCGNQQLEPELTRADFDALIATPDGTTYPSVDQGLRALGFDGLLAGAHFA